MNDVNSIPNLIQQLESIYQEVQSISKPAQAKRIEKNLQGLYDDLCAAYLEARPEHRVDIAVSLVYRDPLLAQLVVYFRSVAKQAAASASKKRQEASTRQLVRQAVAAYAMLDRKVIVTNIEETYRMVQTTGMELGMDTYSLALKLDVPYRYYVQRAIQYQKGRERVRAMKALSIALKLNPKLDENERVLALASMLTGETEQSAILTLSDGYVLQKFIQQIEHAHQQLQASTSSKSRSTLEIIRSWFNEPTP